jgi:hypothetical protein
MKKGDIVRIVSLPPYWGAADIRGKICLLAELIQDSNFCTVMLGDSRFFVIAVSHLEKISELSENKNRS